MARFLGLFVLFVVLVAGVVGIIGSTLPAEHTTTRSVVVPATQDRVWGLIDHVQDYPHWRTGIKQVEKLPDVDGKLQWAEHSSMGTIPEVVTESDPMSHRVVTIADPNLPFGGNWVFDLSSPPPPAPQAQTTVTITENGVIRNVFFRFMSRYFFGYSGTVDQFEQDLVKAVQ